MARVYSQATMSLAKLAQKHLEKLKAALPRSPQPIVLGNIKPSDDYCHKAGPEINFNESVYYNFFDRRKATGGFVRCGNRVNEGQAEITVCLYQPNGSVLFIYKRPKISSN